MRKKRNSKKLRASALSILLAGSMMLGMVPGGMGQVYAADADTPVKEEQTGFLDKAKDFFSDMGDGITDFFAGDTAEAEPAAALDEKSIVDADTSQGWQPLAQYTTENIGRIWTDKSVYNESMTLPGIGGGAEIPIEKPKDSDFMVGLSALSSTSNTSVTTQTPLDIVLVLDMSGSMGPNGNVGNDSTLVTYTYEETYRINTGFLGPNYYAKDENGEYVAIEKVTQWGGFDHWELNGREVEPKTSAGDTGPNRIQFYSRTEERIQKIDALKTAVNGFIDATAVQNEKITDESKQHHISIVKYADDSYYQNNQDSVGDNHQGNGYNYSQIVSNLTGDMNALGSTVDALEEGGGTAADYGMTLANRVLENGAGHGARANAQKVVVMFTDGDPNHGSGFNASVATDAIEYAKTLKDAGALVYTVGVVNGANPDADINTDRETNINAYLHSVSSNYPNATGWGRVEGSWRSEWRLGDRAEDSHFYKAATSSEELNGIFQEISQEINSGTGYPTETPEGFENTDGYVTFHDQLGDYMQVDSFNTLVLEDQTFKAEESKEGGVIKYTYSGNAGEGKDVSNIVITVTPGTGSAGDTVDVSIPAALLPLRHFQVDISENTMNVTDKYPLRLFYNASLRDEAKESLANPDQDMKNYIAENSDEGKVYFYSNKYTESKLGPSENTTLGDTVATFEPATGNSFYYFTENTFLFADKELSNPVTSYNVNGTEEYWYEKTYYEVDNGTTSGVPKKVTEAVSFRSHPMDEVKDWVDTAINGEFGEQYYIKAGAPRLTRIDDLTLGKGDSAIPNTATEVIAPNWDDDTNQKYIEVSLGNNGRLAVELPGTLEIKKMVTSEVTAPEKDFNFKLSLTDAEGEALTGEFNAQKFDAQGKVSGDAFTVHNDAAIALKHGESVQVYGLSNGDKYNIEETEIPKGFTPTKNPMEGTIVGNQITLAEFENTYAVTPVELPAEDFVQARKVLSGRDWQDTDEFAFELRGQDAAPLPEASEDATVDPATNTMTKSVKNDETFSFGSVTFERPGTYVYYIEEAEPTEGAILGVTYSKAVYRVTVTVEDNGEGKLSADATMVRMLDDNGTYVGGNGGSGEEVPDDVAVITNSYNAEAAQWGPQGTKIYTDNSGKKPLKMEDFMFQIEAIADGTVVDDITYNEAGPLPGTEVEGKHVAYNGNGGQIHFSNATFAREDVGKHYLYKLTEIVPDGVSKDNPTKDGMTYDTTVYYVRVAVGQTTGVGGAAVTVSAEYLNEGMQVIPNMTEFTFSNSYTPTPVIIGDDTVAGIEGKKILNGRNMTEGEFSFELTANNQAAIAGLADGSIVFEGDTTSMKATAPAAGNGFPADFAFGSIQFKKPGTYTFNMKEVEPEQDGQGLTCDRHTEVVTVKVTDIKGVLEAVVSYDEDGATFENTYEASHSYSDDGGVVVTKTLEGRRMNAEEFDFTITGIGENKDKANEKLAEADKNFKNVAAGAGRETQMQKLQNVQFTEADAGQTFTYLIDEMMPEEADRAGGVTYDESEYTLAITVTDDGDGTMSTSTTVSRVKGSDGTTLDAPEVLGTYTAGKDVVAVPFVNKYKAGSVTVDTSDVETGARLRKQLNGRAWAANESFSFTMSPVANGEGKVPPMPVAVPENGIVADENGNLVATVTADAGTPSGTDVYFGFGSITYEEAGTYVYTVKENVPDPVAGGMTYSTNMVTITVTVTDPGTGTLEARLTAVGSERTRRFINTYDASLNLGAAGGLAITKTLKGHALAEEQFEFKVKAVTDEEEGTATVEEAAELFRFNKGETEVTFKNQEAATDGETVTMKKTDVDFTLDNLGKVYKYEVSEVHPEGVTSENPTKDGYTYDTTTHTLALEVTDDGDGTLTLHAKVDDTEVTKDEITADAPIIIGFNNTYAATGNLEGEKDLIVEKILDGRDWIESDSFSFKLEATGDTVAQVGQTVTLPDNASKLVIDGEDEDHKAAFGNITFTKPGKYTFAVSEIIPSDAVNAEGVKYSDATDEQKAAGRFVLNGITYDTYVKKIIVDVNDNHDGTLTAVIAEGSNALTFRNKYAVSTVVLPTDKQFKVTKELVGRDWTEADAFEFKLTPVDGAPMPAEGGEVVSATKDAVTQTFGTITYSKAGTYEYQIKETIPENKEEGMTYDTHTATVTVEVTEDFATGTLSVASVTYSDGADGAQFTNVLGDNTKEVTSGDTDVNNGMIGVGDELTYTINWVNDGVDEETGAPTAATVTITDKVPEGTEFVSAKNDGEHKDGTVTWTIDAKAAETGSVSFTVKVTGGTEVQNQASVKVGENDPKVTNTVHTTVPGKDSALEEGDTELQIGDVLTYTISYMNPEDTAATVIITDNIPDGLTFVEASDNGVYADGVLTWTLTDVPAGQKGTVTFKASVNESAVEKVENKATIHIGENEYSTDTDSKEIAIDGNLAISKTIALTEGQGTEIDTTKEFTFTVDLKDTAGNALTQAFDYIINDKDGNKVSDGTIENGNTLKLKHGETATINGLPSGVQFTVTETAVAGYTSDQENNAVSGTIPTDDTAKADFTNTYSVTGALTGAENLTVTKNFTGRADNDNPWLETDKFTFKLEAADDETKAAVENDAVVLPDNAENIEINASNASTEGYQAAFGDITFNKVGTYKFTVTEKPSGIAGVKDDENKVRDITVTVSDKGDGTLNVVVAEESENLTFNNVYSASTTGDVAGMIDATKTLTGRDMNAGEFDFEVVTRAAEGATEFAEEVILTGKNAEAKAGETADVTFAKQDGNGSVDFTYDIAALNKAEEDGYATKDGNVWTVNYKARELTKSLPGGVTPGNVSFDFSIVVTDNKDGTLTATVQYPEGGIAFTNAYSTTSATLPGETLLKVKKEFTGKEWGAESFKFTLTQTGGDANAVTMPETELVLTKDEAEKAFGSIAFDAVGNYQFTVKEVANDNGGVSYEDGATITYDNHSYVVDVEVTDNGDGALVANPTVQQSGSPTFKNTFNPAKEVVTLAGTKAMTGRELRDTDKFQFTIKALTEGAPLPAVTTVENVEENISFAPITYDVPETEAVYEYEITEEDTTINGVAKDSGKIKATVTITYDATTGTTAQKVEYAKEGGNGGEGFAFVNKYEASPAEPIASIEATKTVTPSEGNSYVFDGGEFEFKVTPSGNNDKNTDPIPEAITVYNDKDGKILIAEDVVFTAPETYEYTVAEVSNGLGGMAYDDTTYTIQVVVSNDEGNAAQLTTAMTITNNETVETVDSMTFDNTYDPAETSVTFSGIKNLTGKDLMDGDFNFVLEAVSGEEVVTTEKTVETVVEATEPEVPAETTNEEPITEETADGEAVEEETTTVEAELMEDVESEAKADPQVITETVTETSTVSVDAPMPKAGKEIVPNTGSTFTFGTIKYTAPGTFKYRISEVNDGKTGYTYDDTVYEITVVVTDEGGKLTANVTGADAIVFNNSYKALPVTLAGETALKATKTLEGRDLQAEEFEFELKDKDGNSVQTVKNDADGNVTFGELTFKEVGTFYYTISEKETGLGGITYDETVYTVKVDVADAEGQLKATVTYLNGDGEVEVPTFVNTYKAADTEVTLGASKVYEGAELKEGQFTFELKDKDGKVVSEAKNTEKGQVAFETITYDEAGTYEYTISEKNDKQENVTYDKAVYDVTVEVTDNGKGSLIAEIAYADGKAPVFTNKYTKPAEPEKPSKPEEPKKPGAVQTGDTTPIVGLVVVMVVALAAIVAVSVMFFRKRRR